MTLVAALGLVAGLALATLLVLSHGVSAIWHSAAVLGLGGFAVTVALQLALIALMGMAWWLLGRPLSAALPSWFIWARLIRDSAAEALPLSQVGGYVIGARALALTGLPGAFAAGSTVVDVTVELVAQLGYTIIGLVLLQWLRPDNGVAVPGLAAITAMSVAVALFIAVQARGAGYIERGGLRIARELLGRSMGEAGAVQACIRALHDRPATLLRATMIHLTSWILSGVATWVVLALMQRPLTLAAALVIDSLLYGMRSVAFMVPNAIGVQEGGFILLGALFGLSPDAGLALSLIRRARDLVIGVPALLVWQTLEGRRAWRTGTGLAPPSVKRSTP